MMRPNLEESTRRRFDAKVSKTATCWLWTGATVRGGYGQLHDSSANKNRRANRVAYELYVGPIPDGLMVLHSCDNPQCVNPDHLSVGTNTDNMRDMVRKGRKAVVVGEALKSKLSEAGVRMIRTSPLMVKELAQIFGVAVGTIYRARVGKSWKHV